ncbi:hypothetical protein AAVH_28221 [Aphelenchoides avenae]|nr:hypothetical protein AAVH_28221 [Aphelenchus avenae]
MLRYATVITLCLVVSLKLGKAGESDGCKSCTRILENVSLRPATRGSAADGTTQEFNCYWEKTQVACDSCCTAWGLKHGKDNVTSNVIVWNTGAPNECFCCAPGECP